MIEAGSKSEVYPKDQLHQQLNNDSRKAHKLIAFPSERTTSGVKGPRA